MARHEPPVSIAGSAPAQINMPGVRPATLGEKLQCRADLPIFARRRCSGCGAEFPVRPTGGLDTIFKEVPARPVSLHLLG